MPQPRTVPINLRVSPKFKKWLAKEKKRMRFTAREMTNVMAIAYILYLKKSGHPMREKVTPWPQDRL